MTYAELLRATEAKKRRLIKQFNAAMKDPKTGFLVRHELKTKPGTIAYLWLAKDFCDHIINHYEELIADPDADPNEISTIYMHYYDNDPDLYEALPWEARLFDD